jgi:8-oxo-dGTP pyrophosphatase MutT (NUDIX family)
MWTVLEEHHLLDFSPWLRVIRQKVQLPNGVVIDDYVLTPGRDYAMVVALNTRDEVLVVRQYKHGLGRAVYDFPAGYLDHPGEPPLAAAQRELREETGYAADTWISLGAFALDTNRSGTRAHFFLARDLTQVGEQALDPTEALVFEWRPAADLLPLMHSGDMPGIGCPAAWGLARLTMRDAS